MTNEIRTMHLFAGVGGGILADLILGHRPVVAVEWDNYCCNVLRERVADGWFDGMHVWEGDVQLFDPSQYKGQVDCIHAGFPCQDISVAGNQKGVENGTRSGLYREVLRIADVLQPRYIFLENVAGIVSGDNGGMLRTVVGDLTSRGYDAVWTCLSAAQVGANHKRDRWWLLAYPASLRVGGRSSEGCEAREREVLQGEPKGSAMGGEAQGCSDVGNTEHLGCPTTEISRVVESRDDGQSPRQKQARKPKRSSQQHEAMADSTCSKGDEHEADRGNGKPSAQELSRDGDGVSGGCAWWKAEPDVGRVADGVSDVAHRLKALGNGQVPLQAATAFRILWELKNPN